MSFAVTRKSIIRVLFKIELSWIIQFLQSFEGERVSYYCISLVEES